MIRSVSSNLPTFKPLRFHPGLNAVVSARASGSTEGNTRNSAGKTSFVELVQFLLGADCDARDLFRKKAFIEHSFSGTFQIAGEDVTVERSGSNPSRILLDAILPSASVFRLRSTRQQATTSVSNTEWNQYLGHAMFGLPSILNGSAYGESYTPGFRPMFSYFARRDGSEGFISPERQSGPQQRWDWQVNLSYLLGLDWRISHDLNKVRQRERTLKELKKAAKDGAFGQLIGTAAELRPLVVVAEDRASRLRQRLHISK